MNRTRTRRPTPPFLPGLLALASCTLGVLLAGAPAVAEPFTPAADDTVVKLLASQTGKVVTLKLGCNEELTGKVRAVSAEVVHLGELSGKEFYDAAVATSRITAVLVRAR